MNEGYEPYTRKPRPFLTPSEVRDILRVSERTLRTWEARGLIKAVRLGRTVRYRPEDVERAMDGGVKKYARGR